MTSERGIDIINEAMGQHSTVLSPSMEILRADTVLAIGELLCYGARVRPVLLAGNMVGYLRGLRLSERQWLTRMYLDGTKRTLGIIKLATTLTDDTINSLTSLELRRLLKLILEQSKSDYALQAWVYPFSTTTASEKLWCTKCPPITQIHTPEGVMTTQGMSEVYTHWCYMASLREEVKGALKATQDAAMIVRSHVGKSANGLSQELSNVSESLKSNIASPWYDMGVTTSDVDLDDGWGHSMDDSSLEGLMREYRGMVEGDKHEQFMQFCLDKQKAEILAERDRIKNIQGRVAGIAYEERALTPEDMKRLEAEERMSAQEREVERQSRIDNMDRAVTGSRDWNFEC